MPISATELKNALKSLQNQDLKIDIPLVVDALALAADDSDALETLVIACTVYCSKLESAITTTLLNQAESQDKIALVKQYLDGMLALRKQVDIAADTQRIYQNTIDSIIKYIHKEIDNSIHHNDFKAAEAFFAQASSLVNPQYSQPILDQALKICRNKINTKVEYLAKQYHQNNKNDQDLSSYTAVYPGQTAPVILTGKNSVCELQLNLEQLSRMSIPDFIAQFPQGTDNPLYDKTVQELKQFVSSQLILLMSRIELCEPLYARVHLSYIKTLKKQLSADFHGKFDEVASQVEIEINKKEHEQNNTLKHEAENNTIESLTHFMDDCFEKHRYIYAALIKLCIEGKIKAKLAELSNKLKAKNTHSGLERARKQNLILLKEILAFSIDYYQYEKQLQKQRKAQLSAPACLVKSDCDFENNCSTLFIALEKEFADPLNILINIIKDQKTYSEINIDIWIESLNYLLVLFQLMDFRPDAYLKLFHKYPDLQFAQCNRVTDEFINYLMSLQNRFENLVQTREISNELLQIMNTWQRVNPLLLEFKKILPMHTKLKAIKSYQELNNHYLSSVQQWISNAKVELIDNPILMNRAAQTRDDFYAQLYKNCAALADSDRFMKPHIGYVAQGYHYNPDIIKNLMEIEKRLNSLLPQVLTYPDEACRKINIWRDNIRACQYAFKEGNIHDFAKEVGSRFDAKMNDVLVQLDKQMIRIDEKIKDRSMINGTADAFILAKKMATEMPHFAAIINKWIDDKLEAFNTANGAILVHLNTAFKNHSDKLMARRIIAEHNAFAGEELSIRNRNTGRVTIDEVLTQLTGTNVNKTVLKQQFVLFEEKYWELVNEGLKTDNISILINNTKLIAKDKNISHRDKVRSLLAHYFAYWTIKNSEHYQNAVKKNPSASAEDLKNYLLKPLPAQVIAIFRLFGMDAEEGLMLRFFNAFRGESKTKLYNHLEQILTGEGKSVVMAMSALLYANVMESKVDCGCYTDTLTQRDKKAFDYLFKDFEADHLIQYETFNTLCEQSINKRAGGDHRTKVENLFSSTSKAIKTTVNASADNLGLQLVFDEADVFFKQDFYSGTYRPTATLKDPTINALMKMLWMNRSNPNILTLNNIKKTKEYENLCRRYSGWELLIDEVIKSMVQDLKRMEAHKNKYEVIDGKIYYKEYGTLSSTQHYGYSTVWAHFDEAEKSKVAPQVANDAIGIYLNCGNFSYNEEFKHRYHGHISGVTGTLTHLSIESKRLLEEEYDINLYTWVPTGYNSQGRKIVFDTNTDYKVVKEKDHFKYIHAEIKNKLGEGDKQRAILVFFESKEKLMAFYNSTEFKEYSNDAEIMVESTPDELRDSHINTAATRGRITLAIGDYGRGTDFKCNYDESLNANGGMHVISTSIPPNMTEEIQIRGRTSRQGSNGSYSMVVTSEELEEKYNLKANEQGNSTYEAMCKARAEKLAKAFAQQQNDMPVIKQDHDKSNAFIESLKQNNKREILNYLIEQNKVKRGKKRTIIALDATGSMKPLLNQAKANIAVMLDRIRKILIANDYEADLFEVQIVAYRNYPKTAVHELLEISESTNDISKLQYFLNNIDAKYGAGNEAIELAFWHLNQELAKNDNTLKPSQMILIGDMPPNTSKEVDSKRGMSGFMFGKYIGTQFEQPVYLYNYKNQEGELNKTLKSKIPVQTVYLTKKAEDSFKTIANLTEGECIELDVNANDAAERLTTIVAKKVLKDIDAALEDAYEEAYVKRKGYIAPSSSSSAPVIASPQGMSSTVSGNTSHAGDNSNNYTPAVQLNNSFT